MHIQPFDSLPREKLKRFGADALQDAELLAILLGSGTKNKNVFDLAADLVEVIDGCWPTLSIEDLEQTHGIGSAKASTILAALEFARRRIRPHGLKIRAAKDAIPLIQHLGSRQQEHFICISLNGAHEVIATRVVTIGLVNSTQVHPREVFCEPLSDRASAIIVAHNHPSGNLEASPEDCQITTRLREAGKILGIKLLDHIIFSQSDFYSMAESELWR